MLNLKIIKGFPNYYISFCGKVFNKNMKELSFDYSNEYKRVNLNKDGVQYKHFVHVLVCTHFKRRPKNTKGLRLVVNHKDHIKHNCHGDNLEYETQSGNIKKYYQHKRLKDKICHH